MKFARAILSGLALLAALAVLLAAAAFVPAVQTWAARLALAREAGASGTLGSLSAGTGGFDVGALRLEAGGVVLTVPSLRAQVPLLASGWSRRFPVRSLVAKGWTLDLSHAAAPGRPAEAERLLAGLLGRWRLPGGVSLDGIDLEGDIVVAMPAGSAPMPVHVVVTGGGVAAGKEGHFEIGATATGLDSSLQLYPAAARGRAVVALDARREVARVALTAVATVKGGSLPAGLALSADVAAAPRSGLLTGTVGLSRSGRRVATLSGAFSAATRRLAGNWELDVRDADFAAVAASPSLPALAIAGKGAFEADPETGRVHASGRLRTEAGRLEAVAPALGVVGPAVLDARFEGSRTGRSLRFSRLSVHLAGRRPIAEWRALQPFDLDERTGGLTASDPRADWAACSIEALPLSWLGGSFGGFSVSGGAAAGTFLARAVGGGFDVRPETPLKATGVTLWHGGVALREGLELSLNLFAHRSAGGWRVRAAPLTVSAAGRRLASLEGEASGGGADDRPVAFSGKWNADLEGLRLPGRSASGDFSGTSGQSGSADAHVAAVGVDPADTLTASVHVDRDDDGACEFFAPVKIALGPRVSELTASGTWTGGTAGPAFDAKLTGGNVFLGPLPPLPAGRVPFWGARSGRLRVEFDGMTVGNRDLRNLAGTFVFGPGAVSLADGRCDLPPFGAVEVAGSLRFAAAAKPQYRLRATFVADKEIDAAPYFPNSEPGQGPLLEGRFSVGGSVASEGADLEDLAGRASERLQLESTAGVLRIFRANVATLLPQVSTPVSDTLGSVGSAVGSLFGVRRRPDSGAIRIDPGTQAILDFSNQVAEIAFDRMDLSIARGPDRTIRLLGIDLTSSGEHVTGSGRIAYAKGLPWAERPLGLELRLGVRAGMADLLANTGLLSPATDDQGYALFAQPIRFGGTLRRVDNRAWLDLLAKAAVRKPGDGRRTP